MLDRIVGLIELSKSQAASQPQTDNRLCCNPSLRFALARVWRRRKGFAPVYAGAGVHAPN
jgi:hypothetical protein